MDNKKLIGTIVGVIGFVALIAGATFAWLTTTVNVTNGTYNAKSKNFVITYAGANQISNPIMLAQANTLKANMTTATSATVSDDAWAAVTASKTENDAAASSFKIKLAISDNTLTTNSIVYAVCKSDCPATALISAINTSATTPTATCGSGVAACGVIKGGSKTEVTLYNDTSTFNKETAANATYNIYVWYDGPTITDADVGKKFAGYIYAEASQ